MSTQHTQLPWRSDYAYQINTLSDGDSGCVYVVCTFPDTDRGHADKRHVMACVNACAGKTDKELQGHLYSEGELACAVELARKDERQKLAALNSWLVNAIQSVKPVRVRVAKDTLERVAVYPAEEIDAIIAKAVQS